MAESEKKIVIAGYYGFGNAGDEALLYQTVKLLKKVYVSPKITVLYRTKELAGYHSTKPFERSRLLGELSYVNRWNPFRVIQSVFLSDAVVFGGGGIFQDRTSRRSFWYYASIVWTAQFFKKKIYLLAQGVGPFVHKSSENWFKRLIKNVTGWSVRDQETLDYVQSLQVANPPVLAADLLCFGTKLWLRSSEDKAPIVGICLKNIGNNDALSALSQRINALVYDLGLLIFNGSDSAAYEAIDSEKVVHKHFVTNLHLQDENNHYKLQTLIGMRYHACLWAALRGIPFFAVSDDVKLVYLAKSLNQPYFFISDTTSPEDWEMFRDQLDQFFQQRDQYATALLEALPPLFLRAEQSMSLFNN